MKRWYWTRVLFYGDTASAPELVEDALVQAEADRYYAPGLDTTWARRALEQGYVSTPKGYYQLREEEPTS